VSTPEPPIETACPPLSSPDPFELPKRIRRLVQERSKAMQSNPPGSVTYLWANLAQVGIAPSSGSSNGYVPLEHWLNVLDEAASLGVGWLALTCGPSLSAFPGLWDLCHWAQDPHEMMVCLHTNATAISGEELAQIKRLNTSKIRLFVDRKDLERYRPIEAQGITLRAANPQDHGERPNCLGPSKMVYVDSRGALYTCGLVAGNCSYHLGTIYEGTLGAIMENPGLPHAVEEPIHRVTEGCDGCPALVLNFE